MMKRLISLLLVFLLLCPGALAESTLADRYEAAATLMVSGDYEGAAEAFSTLIGYSDAPQMAIYCRGLALMAQQDYTRARKAFSQLDAFKDAPVLAISCQGMAARAEAEALLAAGTITDLQAASAHLLDAASFFEQIDYLPEMAAQAAECLALIPDLTVRHFDRLDSAAFGLCTVYRGNLAGVVNARGQLIIPCQWHHIALYETAVIVEKDGKCGAFSLEGEVILPCEWDAIFPFNNTLGVRKNGLTGVMSFSGEEVFPCKAFDVTSFYSDEWVTMHWQEGQETKHTDILLEGSLLIPDQLYIRDRLTDELLILCDDARQTTVYHLPTQQQLLPLRSYDDISRFGDGFIVVEDWDASLFSCYSATGEVLPVPQGAIPFDPCGIWVYGDETGWMLTDLQGRVLQEGAGNLDTKHLSSLRSNWLVLQTDEGAFLMDENQHVLLTADVIHSIWEDRYVSITTDGTAFIADLETGSRVEPPEGSLRYCGEGVFATYIEESGYTLFSVLHGWTSETVYDKIDNGGYENGLLMVTLDGLRGLLDPMGQEAAPCKYNLIMPQDDSPYYRVCIKVDNKYQDGLLSPDGRELLPCGSRYAFLYGDLYNLGDTLYNTLGEEVFNGAGYNDWDACDGYIFALTEDDLLTIIDSSSICIY